jgi:hypothetical protein
MSGRNAAGCCKKAIFLHTLCLQSFNDAFIIAGTTVHELKKNTCFPNGIGLPIY